MAQLITQEVGSWGESLQQYDRHRQQLPWASDHPDYGPPRFVTHAEIKRKDREFDPVTMRYRSKEREQQVSSRERKAQEEKQQRLMRRSREWDLITNSAKDMGTIDPRAVHRSQSHTPKASSCNIISHLPKSFHTSLQFDERQVQAYHSAQLQTAVESAPSKQHAREFNILSNKCTTSAAEARERAAEERIRREIDAKYWQQHDWDPISGTYYDQNKEFEQQNQANMRLHALRDERHDASKQPEYFSKAEGVAYDIISKEVRNPIVYNTVCARQERRMRRPAPLPQRSSDVFQQAHRPGMEDFGKTSFHRFTQENHGYDLITSNDKDFIPPRVAKPPAKWTKLQPRHVAAAPSTAPVAGRNLAATSVSSPIAGSTQSGGEQCTTQRVDRSPQVPMLNFTALPSSQKGNDSVSNYKSVRTSGFR